MIAFIIQIKKVTKYHPSVFTSETKIMSEENNVME